jgi:hypothetical protein
LPSGGKQTARSREAPTWNNKQHDDKQATIPINIEHESLRSTKTAFSAKPASAKLHGITGDLLSSTSLPASRTPQLGDRQHCHNKYSVDFISRRLYDEVDGNYNRTV